MRLALGERKPIRFLGRMGGVIPLPEEILAELEQMAHHIHGHNGYIDVHALGQPAPRVTL